MLSLGPLLVGLIVIVAHGDAFAGTCVATLKVVRPIAGAGVGLQEEIGGHRDGQGG